MIADHYKQKGNDAMKSNDFNSAVKFYCQAISQSPQNHVLYSNRSAAYIKLECYQEALDDAEKTIALQKDWAKVNAQSHNVSALALQCMFAC